MGKPMSSESRWMYAKTVTRMVFRHADTITIRLLIGNASLLWAVVVFYEPSTFTRHGYEIMSQAMPDWAWASVFALHGIGVYWRIYDPTSRPGWALLVNALGFAVWALSTLSVSLALGRISPMSSMEITLCAASAWAFYRTGLQEESLTP